MASVLVRELEGKTFTDIRGLPHGCVYTKGDTAALRTDKGWCFALFCCVLPCGQLEINALTFLNALKRALRYSIAKTNYRPVPISSADSNFIEFVHKSRNDQILQIRIEVDPSITEAFLTGVTSESPMPASTPLSGIKAVDITGFLDLTRPVDGGLPSVFPKTGQFSFQVYAQAFSEQHGGMEAAMEETLTILQGIGGHMLQKTTPIRFLTFSNRVW